MEAVHVGWASRHEGRAEPEGVLLVEGELRASVVQEELVDTVAARSQESPVFGGARPAFEAVYARTRNPCWGCQAAAWA